MLLNSASNRSNNVTEAFKDELFRPALLRGLKPEELSRMRGKKFSLVFGTVVVPTRIQRKPCSLVTSKPFRYLAERVNPCHGNLSDNSLPLPSTRFPKPFRQAFFAIWVSIEWLAFYSSAYFCVCERRN
ncbi:hypothetical protein AVEN_32904-1 [Araneus ventricosus]|uniref:Uncharacterized protein n=1 Tax=Araneus ventricosus TaxID=182803 RepID=A0A4Y2IKZ8_ARAVE|nr:hypothetical protein AVEN_32904-1 [Araneus ventricosus]